MGAISRGSREELCPVKLMSRCAYYELLDFILCLMAWRRRMQCWLMWKMFRKLPTICLLRSIVVDSKQMCCHEDFFKLICRVAPSLGAFGWVTLLKTKSLGSAAFRRVLFASSHSKAVCSVRPASLHSKVCGQICKLRRMTNATANVAQ